MFSVSQSDLATSNIYNEIYFCLEKVLLEFKLPIYILETAF